MNDKSTEGEFMTNNKYNCDCNVIHSDMVNLVRKSMLTDKTISKLALFFRVIGDPTRCKILSILDNNELCVCDIANLLNMTKSSISHQLKVLKDNNIVKARRSKKEIFYTLDDEHVSEVFEVALCHIGHFNEGENDEEI